MKLSLLDQAIFKLEEAGMGPVPMGGAMIIDPKTAPGELTGQAIANHLAARVRLYDG